MSMPSTPQEFAKWTVVQLKAELSERRLEVTGKKSELIERLVKHIEQVRREEEEEAALEAAEATKQEDAAATKQEDADKESVKEESDNAEAEDKEEGDEEEAPDAAEQEEEAKESMKEMIKNAVRDENEAEEEDDEEMPEKNTSHNDLLNDEEEEEEHDYEEELEEEMEEKEEEDDDEHEYMEQEGEFITIDGGDEEDEEGDEANEEEEEENGEEAEEEKHAEKTAEHENIEIELHTEEDKLGEDEAGKKETKTPAKRAVRVVKKKQEEVKKEEKKEEKAEVKEKKAERKKEEIEEDFGNLSNIDPFGDDDFNELEEKEEKEHQERMKTTAKRFFYKIGKNLVQKFLDTSRLAKCILISPFERPHLEYEQVQKSMNAAYVLNMQLSQKTGEFGWMELQFRTNEEAQLHKKNLKESLKGLEISNTEESHIRSQAEQYHRRLNRNDEFRDKFRDLILLGSMDLDADHDSEKATEEWDAMEDELVPMFPKAVCISVPHIPENKTTRFILVEYESSEKAKSALKDITDKEIVVSGKKVDFGLYSEKYVKMRVLMKREADERKLGEVHVDPKKLSSVRKEFLNRELLDVAERKRLGKRLSVVHKSTDLLRASSKDKEKKERRMFLLGKERSRITELLRIDDLIRSSKGLPHLSWKTGKEKQKSKWEARRQSFSPRGGRGRGRGGVAEKRVRSSSATDYPPAKQSRSDFGNKRGSPAGSRQVQFSGRGGPTSRAAGRGNLRVNIEGRGDRGRGDRGRVDRGRGDRGGRGGRGGRGIRGRSSSSGRDFSQESRDYRSSSAIQRAYTDDRRRRMIVEQQQQQQQSQMLQRQQQQQQQQQGMLDRGGRYGSDQSRTFGASPTNRSFSSDGGYTDRTSFGSNRETGFAARNVESRSSGFGASSSGGQSFRDSSNTGQSAMGVDSSNPVQLLLGLSKVLSNQIKNIQGESSNSDAVARSTGFNNQSDGNYDSYGGSQRGGGYANQGNYRGNNYY